MGPAKSHKEAKEQTDQGVVENSRWKKQSDKPSVEGLYFWLNFRKTDAVLNQPPPFVIAARMGNIAGAWSGHHKEMMSWC